jgi:hypothetical protein
MKEVLFGFLLRTWEPEELWNILTCSPFKIDRFGGTLCFNLQGRTYVTQETKVKADVKQSSSNSSCWFPAWLILKPLRYKPHYPPKRRLNFNGLHGAVSQKTRLITSAAIHLEALFVSELSYIVFIYGLSGRNSSHRAACCISRAQTLPGKMTVTPQLGEPVAGQESNRVPSAAQLPSGASSSIRVDDPV